MPKALHEQNTRLGSYAVDMSARGRAVPYLGYVLLAALWFLVSDVLLGFAIVVALVVAVIGVTVGVVRHRHEPAAPIPRVLYVGISLMAGSGALLLTASAVAG